MANGEANGNGFRKYLALWLFLGVQTAAGIWWAATTTARVESVIRDMDRLSSKQEVLQLQFNKLDKEFAVFNDRENRKGGE